MNMNTNIYMNTGNSKGDQKYFLEHLDEFGTIAEVSCVFDVDNLIFFDDIETESRFTFVAKTYEGHKIYLKSINCGYSGSGPNSFRDILEKLGVPKKIAHDIYVRSAVKVYFDNNGEYIKHTFPRYFIDSRPQHNKILKHYVITNMAERKLYLINPEKYMDILYDLLNNFVPYKIEYWIGYDSELDHTYRLDTRGNRAMQIDRERIPHKKKAKTCHYLTANQVSLILYGESYDLLLLVPQNLQLSFLESLILFYTSTSFLEDNRKEIEAVFYPRFYHRWLKRCVTDHLHGEIQLEIIDNGNSYSLL